MAALRNFSLPKPDAYLQFLQPTSQENIGNSSTA
jgi:hypothetical protein